MGSQPIAAAPGKNEIEAVVMNTAINALAARPVSERLLELRYGQRFCEEGQDKIQPAPSGLLRPGTLVRAVGGAELAAKQGFELDEAARSGLYVLIDIKARKVNHDVHDPGSTLTIRRAGTR